MIPPGLDDAADAARQHTHPHRFQWPSPRSGPEHGNEGDPAQPFLIERRQAEGEQYAREYGRKQ